ncbi:uncharacterized protein PV09_06656 [Verruconis gallopava]|uniref:Uncharacterized protein n=1 Tax=Verruconis gallopava TaxID=253628 RepID=A0A0D2A5H6_9PEZI|nr:uncharacterized protein PV09_06656 [Verruconis gallopava]KIW01800.1 hypothetical protein PV09_06656 [Verruconis gallopava]
MDSNTDDDDITLLRQSRKFLQELGDAFAHVENVNERDLESIIRKIEPYQEDPQLLDAELGRFIPLLSDKFTQNLQNQDALQKMSKILYTFCKVRGEKVILGLFNNEPRWIEPLLAVFSENEQLPWEQSYIQLLWMAHLMLSPFDLATISSFTDNDFQVDPRLPDGTPSITSQVIKICTKYLSAATIERKAAAKLLVRICIRQDMLNLGILGIMTKWAISKFQKAARESQIHTCLGSLTFLSGLVASGDQKMLGPFLASIFRLSQEILDGGSLEAIRNSAMARKLVIKIQRSTIIHCLQAEQTELDTTEVVEQVIGSLIELLADVDTPVRMTASKALSLVTLKLDPEMAAEVVEAIIASFTEELNGDDTKAFWSVNAAKWHGIVLTFGHLLHRRAVSIEQVPEVLKSILYALSFEQRSTTGKSGGSNVRDAANYGLWALARRCTSKELESISTSLFAIRDEFRTLSSIQYIALDLLLSACFDPDGNVRRGSSAALQELIGRHPNTIIEGISLVQVVDYQAVGLRPRAATKIAHGAAQLDKLYEKAFILGLFTWRGLFAASLSNRSDCSLFLGQFIAGHLLGNGIDVKLVQNLHDLSQTVNELFVRIRKELSKLRSRDQEERQGLILAASWILSALNYRITSDISFFNGDHAAIEHLSTSLLKHDPLSTPEFDYVLSDDFKPRSPRSELVISAALRLTGQLAGFLRVLQALDPGLRCNWDKRKYFALIDRCLSRNDEIVLEQVPAAVRLSVSLLGPLNSAELVQHWLNELAPENRKSGQSADARILALGAAFNEIPSEATGTNIDVHRAILQFMLHRYVHVDTEARISILESLKLILQSFHQHFLLNSQREKYVPEISTILLLALHDYTISERGDVGSLVRLAGLAAVREAWSHGLLLCGKVIEPPDGTNIKYLDALQLHHYAAGASQSEHLLATVLKLSLEKLDRVRLAAIDCWNSQGLVSVENEKVSPQPRLSDIIIDHDTLHLLENGAPLPPKTQSCYDIYSVKYFYFFLQLLVRKTTQSLIKLRVMEGFCSTAGGSGSGASQNLLNARQALEFFLSEPNNAEINSSTVLQLLKEITDINIRLENDQRLVAILEVVAFTLDTGLLLQASALQWRPFFMSVQKAHYKSKNITKLHVCLDVYRGLSRASEIRTEAIRKIARMLLHPIPAVRVYAAETLVTLCDVNEAVDLLEREEWTKPAKDLKEKVERIRTVLCEE